MEIFFRNILEISIMASFLILAVLLIRISFKKASAAFRCVLWMLVGVRLLVPVSISSPFGLVPDVDLSVEQDGLFGEVNYGQEAEGNENIGDVSGIDGGYGAEAGIITSDGTGQVPGENQSGTAGESSQTAGGTYPWENGQSTVGNYPLENGQGSGEYPWESGDGNGQLVADGQVAGTDVGSDSAYIPGGSVGVQDGDFSAGEGQNNQGALTDDINPTDAGENSGNIAAYVWRIATYVWLAGSCLMLLYMLISYLHLRNSLKEAIPAYVTCGEEPVKVYRHESVDSPFLLGIIAPKIYVPLKMMGQDLQFVLAHERTHLRRRDHWLKPLSFLVLALYWFHPLVWVAYILLGRDIELACDERVIRENPKLDRAAYASALLACAVKQPKIAVCPVAFGEVDVKQRVNNVLNYKKPGFWIVLVCALLGVAVVLLFMTVSGGEDNLPAGTEDVQSGEDTAQGGDVDSESGNSAEGDEQNDSGKMAVGELLSTQERVVKYRMYYDVLAQYNEGGNFMSRWNYVTSEFVYERSGWYENYNGEQLQRIVVNELHSAATSKDIIYYKAEEGEDIHAVTLKMLDALITPMMDPNAGNPYTIKEYAIRDQQIVQVGDGIWLLPFIDGYYDYDGVDLLTMEEYRKTDGDLAWNGLLPFMRQGSDDVFYYLLIEENGIYRLQNAGEMHATLTEVEATVTEGEPENELIFYYPVNSLNAPKHERTEENALHTPNCFWVGNGYVFIDDSINGRILVYKNGVYEKSIGLPGGVGMNPLKMYYLQESDELKVVWQEVMQDLITYQYTASFDVSSGMLMNGWRREIGNTEEVLISCCFDNAGELWREMYYSGVEEPDTATKLTEGIATLSGFGEFPYAVSAEFAGRTEETWSIVAKHGGTDYYLRNRLMLGEALGDGIQATASVVMKGTTHVATPEADWNGNPILNVDDNGDMYQMVVDEGGVRIYRLGFAEFDAEDRNDMCIRRVQPVDVTVRQESAVTMSPIEDFKELHFIQVWEWTKDGKFAELVQTQGMKLFEQYDNLEPSVLYEGASGASYSCKMDYDGKIYELTIMYEIDKDKPDVKTVQRVYVEAAENSRKVVLYSADESETIGDFGEYLISSYGVEKQISFTLPEGFTLGAYNRQFSNTYASFLEGDIEEKPGDEFAFDWAITPGGIGTFSEELVYDENGRITGFAHPWMSTGGTWREEYGEVVEGCYAPAMITEYYISYFPSAPTHEDYWKKYPEKYGEFVESKGFWYVFIKEESKQKGFVVFLNKEYFTKEDAIAFARSVKPLANVNIPEESKDYSQVEPGQSLTMAGLLRLAESNELTRQIEVQGMDWFRQYNIPVVGGPANTVSSSYTYKLSHRNKQYQLRVHFKIGKDGAEDTVDTVYIIYPDTGEKQAIYTVRNNVETVDLTEFVDYIDRAYSLDSYITYQLPEDFTLGAFTLPGGDDGALFNGCLLEGDVEELINTYAPEWAVAPGGIGTFTQLDRITFENGEPVSISYGGNHRGVVKESIEKVEGCFAPALLVKVSYDLFSAATWEQYKTEHPEEADKMRTTAGIWHVIICDETMDVGYVVFLNEAYFTKEDAITFAQSVKIVE